MNTTTHSESAINGSNSASLEMINHKFAMATLPVTVAMGMVSVLGIIGNVLVVIVYMNRYKRSNFRYFVIFLAFNDLINCFTSIPMEVYVQMNWYNLTHNWICKSKAYFNVGTSWNSASILLLFSFDRFRKICFPLKMQIRPFLICRICAGLSLTSAITVVPVAFGWSTNSYETLVGSETVTVSVCGKSAELPGKVYDFFLYLYTVGIPFMMCLISILNVMTIRKVICGRRFFLLTNVTRGAGEHSSWRESVDANTITDYVTTSDENESSPSDVAYIRNSLVSTRMDDQKNTVKSSQCHHNPAYEVCSDETNHHHHNANLQERIETISNGRQSSLSEPPKPSGDVSSDGARKTRSDNGRVNRKLIIMFVLTMVFVVTMTLYTLTVLYLIPRLGNTPMTNTQQVLLFTAWRLYFINYMINPFLYGFMDKRFRTGLQTLFCRR